MFLGQATDVSALEGNLSLLLLFIDTNTETKKNDISLSLSLSLSLTLLSDLLSATEIRFTPDSECPCLY